MMKSIKVDQQLSISGQLAAEDIAELAKEGVELVVCNRPDAEAAEQPEFAAIASAAEKAGLQVALIPFKSGDMTKDQVAELARLLKTGKRTHAYCRTGNRSFCLYSAALAATGTPQSTILDLARQVGFDVTAAIEPYFSEKSMQNEQKVVNIKGGAKQAFDVVIIGAGSGGIAASASLLKRNRSLRIAIVDPAVEHYYQPGWTMVGGGIFDVASTRRLIKDLIPAGVSWIKQAVTGFNPEASEIQLDNGECLHYEQLIVSPGLVLNWGGVKGLEDALGKNGVTSNYSYKLAPYTWELVQNLKQGKALFTQPPMPIKCAGAPQKALYLSCDHWRKKGVLKDVDVNFHNAGGVLFGVADYVPALQSYIDRYEAKVHFNQNLQAIDGENKVAYFKNAGAENEDDVVSQEFDMIHVCPPQVAPAFVAESELADAGGWLDVDQYSLQHKRHENIWGLGDVMNTPNAKTMAAVRKQVPVVAQNVIDVMAGKQLDSGYDGYGSCPLTVENGKIVLAEFGYGGKLIPTFPDWLLKGTQATHMAWMLKKDILPGVYWHAMLKGREWLAAPQSLEQVKA